MSKSNQRAQQHICEKVKEAFAEMDKNGDGQVTFKEFWQYCYSHPQLKGVADCFKEIAGDDDLMSLEELNNMCTRVPANKIEENHIKDLFRELDKSGDGQLDRKEFGALMCRCGYKDSVINETFNHIAGGDGMISLDEFLDEWRKSKK